MEVYVGLSSASPVVNDIWLDPRRGSEQVKKGRKKLTT